MDEFNNMMNQDQPEKQPWWNDGDKVGGAAATLVFGCIALIVIALVIKLCLWIIGL